MNAKTFKWTTAVVALFAVLSAATVAFAAAIVKSKSNITNNRIIVVSSSPDFPDRGNLVLMDEDSGEIWMYSGKALTGQQPPKYLGTLVTVGEPIVVESRFNQPPSPR